MLAPRGINGRFSLTECRRHRHFQPSIHVFSLLVIWAHQWRRTHTVSCVFLKQGCHKLQMHPSLSKRVMVLSSSGLLCVCIRGLMLHLWSRKSTIMYGV